MVFAASLLLIGLLLGGYQITTLWVDQQLLNDQLYDKTRVIFIGILYLIIFGWFVNLNYISVHRYYRDRLMDLFMPPLETIFNEGNNKNSDQKHATSVCLKDLTSKGPYHIINSNVVLSNSKKAKFRWRGGDNFIFSQLFCGSNATGWTSSDSELYGSLTLASAMGISGAAINSNAGVGGQGVTRNRVLSMLMGVLNIRLSYWLVNPKWLRKLHKCEQVDQDNGTQQTNVGNLISQNLLKLSKKLNGDNAPNFIYPGLGEVLLGHNLNEDSCWLQLSDGGHFENIGLYELIRRKLKLIIVVDGAADPDYQFTDLANAIEKIRADFGVLIKFQGDGVESLIPVSSWKAFQQEADEGELMRYAKRSYIIGKIQYADGSKGTLIYIATTFTNGLSADLYGYRSAHPEFPDEPTTNQFFDERQFEAYRELGFQTAYKMLNDEEVLNLPNVHQTMLNL